MTPDDVQLIVSKLTMTPDMATVYAALIAAASALLGGILGSLGTYFIQKNAIKNETIEHRRRTLNIDKIKALQQFSVLIYFLEANDGRMNKDFKFSDKLWEITHECVKNVGCLPDGLRDDSGSLIKEIYQAEGGEVTLKSNLWNIRSRIFDEINKLK